MSGSTFWGDACSALAYRRSAWAAAGDLETIDTLEREEGFRYLVLERPGRQMPAGFDRSRLISSATFDTPGVKAGERERTVWLLNIER